MPSRYGESMSFDVKCPDCEDGWFNLLAGICYPDRSVGLGLGVDSIEPEEGDEAKCSDCQAVLDLDEENEVLEEKATEAFISSQEPSY